MGLNVILILIQYVLLKNEFKMKHAFQIVLAVVMGYTINLAYYHILKDINANTYMGKLFFLMLGYIINAFSVSILMLIDVVTFPMEGLSMAIAKKTHWQFHIVRQSADAFAILAVFALTLIFRTPLTIREGTIIGMLLFAPAVGYLMKTLTPILVKYHLMDK